MNALRVLLTAAACLSGLTLAGFLIGEWMKKPGVLGYRFYFNKPHNRTWPFDGTIDWLWAEAEKAGVPIVPVTIINAHRILKKDSLVFHPGKVEVIIDPPLSTASYNSRTLPELMNKTRVIIAGHLAEHSLPTAETLELQKV